MENFTDTLETVLKAAKVVYKGSSILIVPGGFSFQNKEYSNLKLAMKAVDTFYLNWSKKLQNV